MPQFFIELKHRTQHDQRHKLDLLLRGSSKSVMILTALPRHWLLTMIFTSYCVLSIYIVHHIIIISDAIRMTATAGDSGWNNCSKPRLMKNKQLHYSAPISKETLPLDMLAKVLSGPLHNRG